jgi:uncharacterized caspase-like protein
MRKLALLIGNHEFDAPLPPLRTAVGDIAALTTVLCDAAIGGFDEVTPVVDAPSPMIRREIARFLARRGHDDLLLLYFSGHGLLDERGALYLAVKDTEPDFLSATAIPAAFVTGEMDQCHSRRQILILDCCYSGAFERGVKGSSAIPATTFEGNGIGRVVLTATNSAQLAWEETSPSDTAQTSVFTRHLIEGLESGAADLDDDGEVTVDELYEYVYRRVVNENPRQTPSKWSYKQQGEIVLARRRGWTRPPAELPADLRHALDSPLAGVREGAVRELARFLRGNDPDLAETARQAAQQALDDDSRKVSLAAEEVLRAVRPPVSVPVTSTGLPFPPRPQPAVPIGEARSEGPAPAETARTRTGFGTEIREGERATLPPPAAAPPRPAVGLTDEEQRDPAPPARAEPARAQPVIPAGEPQTTVPLSSHQAPPLSLASAATSKVERGGSPPPPYPEPPARPAASGSAHHAASASTQHDVTPWLGAGAHKRDASPFVALGIAVAVFVSIAVLTALTSPQQKTGTVEELATTATVDGPVADPQDALLAEAKAWPLLFGDSLSSAAIFDKSWRVSSSGSDYDTISMIDGSALRFTLTNRASEERAVADFAPGAAADLYLKIDVRRIAGGEYAYAGVVFRESEDGKTGYRVYLGEGYYVLGSQLENKVHMLSTSTTSVSRPLDQGNSLAVLAKGSEITVFINDQRVDHFSGATLASGVTGIVVGAKPGTKTVFDFTNFELRRAPEAAPVGGEPGGTAGR